MRSSRRRRYPSLTRPELLAVIALRMTEGRRVSPLEAAYLRDSGLCWLCGLEVRWNLPDSDPMRASRDHVVARSAGGPGTRGNLRLAHQKCNEERSRPATEAAEARMG